MRRKLVRKIVVCAVAACLIGGLAFWLWPRPRFNLLLITLDTTRADRLGCYGYAAGRTPVLDSLAERGVVCENAYTVAPLTLPAHTSLFTGLYPRETGVLSNGRGRLNGEVPTLAETLKLQGYNTAAFVSSFVLNRKFGLDRGFETYDDEVEEGSGGNPLHRQRDGESVVDSALKWLREKRSHPYFCWIHLYDAHAPYVAHDDLFGDEFSDRPYDGEIAYVDRQVGRVVDFLEACGLASQTLIVVAGDHGESLGEHDERTHGMTLYNSTTHVPLIFRHSGHLVPGGRIAASVSMVDVPPTVIELLGFAHPRRITGTSFKPALVGGESRQSPCYSATDEPFQNYGCSPLRSLTEGDWKYIRTTRVELYNLATDPAERNNLAETDAEKTQKMESRMAEFEKRLVRRAQVEIQLSPAEDAALTSLGYIAGANRDSARPATTDLPDVKDVLPFEARFVQAVRLVDIGSVDGAIARLREIIRDAPSFRSAYEQLAQILTTTSSLDAAADVLSLLVEANPNYGEGHYRLGVLFAKTGRFDDAIRELTKTLELEPDDAAARVQLGKALASNGESLQALEQINVVLQGNRRDSSAYEARASIMSQMGQVEESIAGYRKALKYATRENPDGHINLGLALTLHGDAVEAREHLARAVKLAPRSAEPHYALGVLYVQQRQYDDAIHELVEAVEFDPGHAKAEGLLSEARQAWQQQQAKLK